MQDAAELTREIIERKPVNEVIFRFPLACCISPNHFYDDLKIHEVRFIFLRVDSNH